MKPADLSSGRPTVVHVTHWKAGSQWIHRILRDLCFDRLALPEAGMVQFLGKPVQLGKVYPTLYLTRDKFFSVDIPDNHRRFLVVRDLRDTLVSFYFSVKTSHPVLEQPELREKILKLRAVLEDSTIPEGMLVMMNGPLLRCVEIVETWLNAGEPFYRYEDFLDDDLELFREILLDQCEVDVTPERLTEVVLAKRFEVLTGGRLRGQEDRNKHERIGIAGNWRSYFDNRLEA
jgi:hypothetical protein